MLAAAVPLLAIAFCAPAEPPLIDQVRQRRTIRQAGLAIGGTFLTAAATAGVVGGLIEPAPVLTVAVGGAGVAALAVGRDFITNTELREPMNEASHFEVRESGVSGSGLFALTPIEEGAFLFDYSGEVLNEEQMFARYPQANGRYVACLTDDLYIDGADATRSNVARWMNHAPPSRANVVWKKQRLGPQKAMHFYALRPIAVDEELCFDYGDEYWEALGEKPVL